MKLLNQRRVLSSCYFRRIFSGIRNCFWMTKADIFWVGKYGVILFLITGIISKQSGKLKLPFLILIYFMSLLPSIVLITIV